MLYCNVLVAAFLVDIFVRNALVNKFLSRQVHACRSAGPARWRCSSYPDQQAQGLGDWQLRSGWSVMPRQCGVSGQACVECQVKPGVGAYADQQAQWQPQV